MFYSTVLELKGDYDELNSEADVDEPINLLSLLSIRPDIVRGEENPDKSTTPMTHVVADQCYLRINDFPRRKSNPHTV
jgi:hypothetical protein